MTRHRARKPSARSTARRKDGRSTGISVLYEDSAIVLLNKPAGLPSVPVEGRRMPSALSLLSGKLAPKKQRPFVVHRIDRFTSGIILFAKSEADQKLLIEQFLKHTPEREYQAIIHGVLSKQADKLVHYLRRQGARQTVSSKSDRGATRAVLRYVVEKRLKNATLLRVRLETGLQNQIRVQFARIGHPVIGDRKYSPNESREKGFARVALHAAHLSFKHPRTGEQISFDCPPPEDFEQLIAKLSMSKR